MKVAVIEDDEYKANDLKSVFSDVCCSHLTVEFADSFRSGRQLLAKGDFDVCILDMALPTFAKDGDVGAPESSSLAGKRLMSFIERTRLASKVIVFTQYNTFAEYTEEISYSRLIEVLREECPSVFLGAVRYVIGDESWKSELKNLLLEME